ncbi:hypothetical protein V5J96_002359 [Enterobacter cloacae]|uniref:hypothetical protein n=1 Tax=Enterobacter cloacae TaxID=550 RepID=UPI0005893824|nr:hypothetical protein [Enterobacter cloacae]ELD6623172.1 hypothetical protein [Enterobacter cloacae]ELV2783585.1 hypothetical protein [Enterobacter cloacae]ELV2843534.1 hypothetical protein [Enterobacter cloacae]KIF96629.1 hypothetical protein SD66_07705 [Enterobacter cloacae]MBT1836656.1 hypothetical protein [Enterobacter cloacae]
MYYSDSLITSMDAHKILALKLEHALTGVKDEVLKQAHQINDGATRLSYQLSCFTENYQDVCLRLRKEDSRFLKGIVQLIKHRNVIYKMLYVYIKSLLDNKSENRIHNIQRNLINLGVSISSSMLSSQAFIYSATMAVCSSVHTNIWMKEKITSFSTYAVLGLKFYGFVEQASRSANHLKNYNAYYYNLLYQEELEMMFFLIEPVIMRTPILNQAYASDSDIAYAISRMIKG